MTNHRIILWSACFCIITGQVTTNSSPVATSSVLEPYKCSQTTCKTHRSWEDGGQASDCYGSDLECIPSRNGQLGTKKLNYKSNSLKHLPANVFRTQFRDLSGLAEVTELDLSWNHLTQIDGGAFSGMNNLEILSLVANRLMEIPTSAFTGLGKLKFLNLRINQIETIGPHAFRPLKALETLEISFNKIAAVAPEAFKGLRNLAKLDMINNQLTGSSIVRDSFAGLPKLGTLKLAGNPEHFRLRDINWMEAFGIHSGRRPIKRRSDEDEDEDYGDLLEFSTGGQDETPDYYEVPCRCSQQKQDAMNTVTCSQIWKFFKANMTLECIGKARQTEYSMRSDTTATTIMVAPVAQTWAEWFGLSDKKFKENMEFVWVVAMIFMNFGMIVLHATFLS